MTPAGGAVGADACGTVLDVESGSDGGREYLGPKTMSRRAASDKCAEVEDERSRKQAPPKGGGRPGGGAKSKAARGSLSIPTGRLVHCCTSQERRGIMITRQTEEHLEAAGGCRSKRGW